MRDGKKVLEEHFGIKSEELMYSWDYRRVSRKNEIMIVLIKAISGLAAVKTALTTTAESLNMIVTPEKITTNFHTSLSRNYIISYNGKKVARLAQKSPSESTKYCYLYFPNYLDNEKNRELHGLQIDFLKEFDKNLCDILKP